MPQGDGGNHSTRESGRQEWPSRNCCICDSEKYAKVHSIEGYTLYKCCKCGLLQVSPLPAEEDLREYYNTGYTVDLSTYRQSAEQKANQILERVEQFFLPSQLLEIGSSYGYFLSAAQQRGWHVTGIELSADACAHAKSQLGLGVYCGTLGNIELSGKHPFDTVVALHVLEHCPDPLHVLQLIYTNLRDGGLLVLTMPNARSAEYFLFGKYWGWLTPPAHLFHFSPFTISKLLAKQGFEVLSIETRRGDSPGISFWYMNTLLRAAVRLAKMVLRRRSPKTPASAQSLSARPKERSPRSGGYYQLYQRAYRSIVLVSRYTERMLFPVQFILDRMGLGPEMLIFAKKTEAIADL